MDVILSTLTAGLSGAGPWGALAGAVLTLGVQWYRRRGVPTDPRRPLLDALLSLLEPAPAPVPPVPVPPAPADPVPAPVPAAPVVAEDHRRPLLDALLKALAR